jgi:mersacidin/lichenicidin family type 2 lantibiotic
MNSNIVRAWKDEFYRQSLSDEERAQLPENPVGELELTEAELGSVFAAGGHHEPEQNFSYAYCTHNLECVHPRYSYSDWDDCGRSYRYDICHHIGSYGGDWDDCHTYQRPR